MDNKNVINQLINEFNNNKYLNKAIKLLSTHINGGNGTIYDGKFCCYYGTVVAMEQEILKLFKEKLGFGSNGSCNVVIDVMIGDPDVLPLPGVPDGYIV